MTTEAITPLRQRMIEDMNSRKLCAHTQRGHIYSCKRFAAFLKRSPETAHAGAGNASATTNPCSVGR
jgi:integrase/recombinase XerD